MAAQEVLSGVGLSKSFGPIEVVHGVDIDVRAGEVHALVGENGAGKSTLMKTLSGYLAPSSGEVRMDGAPVTFRDSNEAEAAVKATAAASDFMRRGVIGVSNSCLEATEHCRPPPPSPIQIPLGVKQLAHFPPRAAACCPAR